MPNPGVTAERGQGVKENSFAAKSSLFESLENRSMPASREEDRPLFKHGDSPAGVFLVKSGEVALTMESSSGRSLQPDSGNHNGHAMDPDALFRLRRF